MRLFIGVLVFAGLVLLPSCKSAVPFASCLIRCAGEQVVEEVRAVTPADDEEADEE